MYFKDNKTIMTIQDLIDDIKEYVGKHDDDENHHMFYFRCHILKILFVKIIDNNLVKNDSDSLCVIMKSFLGFNDDDFDSNFLLNADALRFFELNTEQFLLFFDMFSDCVSECTCTDKSKDDVITIINKHKIKYLSN
jgi:hypothetical protein